MRSNPHRHMLFLLEKTTKNRLIRDNISKKTKKFRKRFKRTLFIRTQTSSANFRGIPLCRATKRHLNNSSMVKNDGKKMKKKEEKKKDEKLNHLPVFDLEVYNMARTKLHSPLVALVSIAVKRIEKR